MTVNDHEAADRREPTTALGRRGAGSEGQEAGNGGVEWNAVRALGRRQERVVEVTSRQERVASRQGAR